MKSTDIIALSFDSEYLQSTNQEIFFLAEESLVFKLNQNDDTTETASVSFIMVALLDEGVVAIAVEKGSTRLSRATIRVRNFKNFD